MNGISNEAIRKLSDGLSDTFEGAAEAMPRENEAVDLLSYFAARCDLDMHRGPQGGIGTKTAILLMGEDPPTNRHTIESLTWWAEAESRYRFLKAEAMLAAREWINYGRDE